MKNAVTCSVLTPVIHINPSRLMPCVNKCPLPSVPASQKSNRPCVNNLFSRHTRPARQVQNKGSDITFEGEDRAQSCVKREVDLGCHWVQNKECDIKSEGEDTAQRCVKREVNLGSRWVQNKDSHITFEGEDRAQRCVKREEELGSHCQPLTPHLLLPSLLKTIRRFLWTQSIIKSKRVRLGTEGQSTDK